MSEAGIVGGIPGVPPGRLFDDRDALIAAKVHRNKQYGIDFDGRSGLATAIVLSGGYADDKDYGDRILYTGERGRDPRTGRHVKDQTWTLGNQGLRRAHLEGSPVRVVRGANGNGPDLPESGYRYDGLYLVTECSEGERDGFRICQFTLELLPSNEVSVGPGLAELEGGTRYPGRRTTSSSRIVRDAKIARDVKRRHDFTCQICGIRLEVPGGAIAEGAHIRPLGLRHAGPDVPSNLLCLCPNDHALFDHGALWIDESLTIWVSATGEPIGTLRTVAGHAIDLDALAYHRDQIVTGP